VTGLVLLALGDARPLVDAARAEKIGPALARGAAWLASTQGADGCFGPRDRQHFMYGHAFATLALTELQAAAPAPERAAAIERALRFLVRGAQSLPGLALLGAAGRRQRRVDHRHDRARARPRARRRLRGRRDGDRRRTALPRAP
jgi:hypothetical protein